MLWFPRFMAEPSPEEIKRHAELVRWLDQLLAEDEAERTEAGGRSRGVVESVV